MSNPTIRISGPFGWIWIAWITALLGWALWGPMFGRDTLLLGLRVIFTAFWGPELIGTWVNGRSSGEEVARTLSQVIQWVDQIGKHSDDQDWWKGWSALITGFTVLVAFAAGLAFWPVHPIVGMGVGITVFLWNCYHWLRRTRYG